MILLKDTGNPIDRAERIKINENWQSILKGFNDVQLQLQFLADGEEVSVLLAKIKKATDDANNAAAAANKATADAQAATEVVNDLIAKLNPLLAELREKLPLLDKALSDARTLMAQLETLQGELNTLKGQLETLKTQLDNKIKEANTAIDNTNKAITANNAAVTAAIAKNDKATTDAIARNDSATNANIEKNDAATNANISKNDKATTDAIARNDAATNAAVAKTNTAIGNANNATTAANAAATNANNAAKKMDGWDGTTVWSNSTAYIKNNIVTFNGSTWQALRANTNKQPVEGADWILLAQRGTDGKGSVQKVNGISPDMAGNVPLPEVTTEEVNVKPDNWKAASEVPNSYPMGIITFKVGTPAIGYPVPFSIVTTYKLVGTAYQTVVSASNDKYYYRLSGDGGAKWDVFKEATNKDELNAEIEKAKEYMLSLNSIKILDNRNVVSPPSFYNKGRVYYEFKDITKMEGLAAAGATGAFCTVFTDGRYVDTTGGRVTQIAYTDVGKIFSRVSGPGNTTWLEWEQIATKKMVDATQVHKLTRDDGTSLSFPTNTSIDTIISAGNYYVGFTSPPAGLPSGLYSLVVTNINASLKTQTLIGLDKASNKTFTRIYNNVGGWTPLVELASSATIGSLTDLKTANKTNVVAAVNSHVEENRVHRIWCTSTQWGEEVQLTPMSGVTIPATLIDGTRVEFATDDSLMNYPAIKIKFNGKTYPFIRNNKKPVKTLQGDGVYSAVFLKGNFILDNEGGGSSEIIDRDELTTDYAVNETFKNINNSMYDQRRFGDDIIKSALVTIGGTRYFVLEFYNQSGTMTKRVKLEAYDTPLKYFNFTDSDRFTMTVAESIYSTTYSYDYEGTMISETGSPTNNVSHVIGDLGNGHSLAYMNATGAMVIVNSRNRTLIATLSSLASSNVYHLRKSNENAWIWSGATYGNQRLASLIYKLPNENVYKQKSLDFGEIFSGLI